MADDKSKRGAPDRRRVAAGERYEVDYVKKKTGKSSAAVKQAIQSTGGSRKKVMKKLGK
jgi:hypothetical protein